jgi:lon-related putative ATP-dependent protease
MTDLKESLRIPWHELTWTQSLETMVGESTETLTPPQEIIGQSRAVKAIKFGLSMKSKGYNIFVSGINGTGRRTTVESLLDEFNVDGPAPDDLCYVNNFKNPDQPRLITLKAGQGQQFKRQMAEFIETLKKKIPAVFESDEFQAARNEIINQRMGLQKALFKNFESKVASENFMMVQVQVGPYTRPDLAPVIVGNPMKIEQLESLVDEGKFSGDELTRIKAKYTELSQEMERIFKEAREIDKTIQESLEKLARDWVEPPLRELASAITATYETDAVKTYLDEVQGDVIQNLERFRPHLAQPSSSDTPSPPVLVPPEASRFKEYEVNLLVDNAETKKPPVVIETAPTYRNLFGAVERIMDAQGMWSSDFRHIKAGSLLKANGGFLVLNAMDFLTEAGVWPTLKRTLRNEALEIQTDPFSFLFISAMKPEKIPVRLKVIILGDPEIYDILHWYDEDFRKIFKVKADFDSTMPNTDENLNKLVGFVARVCKDEGLLPFSPSGVEAASRLAVRWAGRKKKITTQFERIADLIREADFVARSAGADKVTAAHVDQANADRIGRLNMIEEKIQELIEDGIIMIDTDGARVGQINGLSVYSLPEFSFGKPSRITAKTSMGKSGIINIEREAELSGTSYNKGVLILTGFLRDRFAQDRPLNLTASITFEQSYSGVDGDSASSTELYALMSALAEKPIDQGIAVTGSVNQHGEIQPIGGVNHKIEGFFKVCKAKGLTGRQGVIVPRRNLNDLVLDAEVVEAIKEGRFHVWAVDHVDQGIEILTGIPAGERDEEGLYPENTINFLVEERLEELSRGLKEYESGPEEEEGEEPQKEQAAELPDPGAND